MKKRRRRDGRLDYHYVKKKWFAIYTRSRFEKKVSKTLKKLGYDIFLPLVKEKRVWSDRIKTVIVPLLPNYVFIKIKKNDRYKVFDCPGIVSFVSTGGKPSVIPEQEINFLETIVKNGIGVQIIKNYKVGDHIRIKRGPLRGCIGWLESKKENGRIIFLLESINQAIRVEVNASDIEKCPTI